ncbi:Myelin-associated oligodendrocyte basic protein [Dissostichus eleginoides]|uniref:Myelin-associated oligodendrocyte basic protein n=1 Tax=Dissostichus eleginoides TaxID=100907 RepID=A0AAD9CG68_DISEL|nr:Myelin-associated oligodendrocyte basic protein [Dissostichus eleginoides]
MCFINAYLLTEDALVCTEDTPNTPVRTEDTANTPVCTEDTPSTPVCTEDTPNTPVCTEDTPNTPVRTEETPNTPVRTEDTPNTPDCTEDTHSKNSGRVGHKAEVMRSNYRVDSLNKILKAKSPESNAGGADRGTKRRRDALGSGSIGGEIFAFERNIGCSPKMPRGVI